MQSLRNHPEMNAQWCQVPVLVARKIHSCVQREIGSICYLSTLAYWLVEHTATSQATLNLLKMSHTPQFGGFSCRILCLLFPSMLAALLPGILAICSELPCAGVPVAFF